MDFGQISELNRKAQKFIPYKIQKGDTLTKIAREFDTDVQTIMNMNSNNPRAIKNANFIYAGRTINVPNPEFDPKAGTQLKLITAKMNEARAMGQPGMGQPGMGQPSRQMRDPRADAIESVAPELMAMGLGGVPHATVGALTKLAGGMPQTALMPQAAGMVARGRLGSNVVMPWQPQISRGMAGALTNSNAHRAAMSEAGLQSQFSKMLANNRAPVNLAPTPRRDVEPTADEMNMLMQMLGRS